MNVIPPNSKSMPNRSPTTQVESIGHADIIKRPNRIDISPSNNSHPQEYPGFNVIALNKPIKPWISKYNPSKRVIAISPPIGLNSSMTAAIIDNIPPRSRNMHPVHFLAWNANANSEIPRTKSNYPNNYSHVMLPNVGKIINKKPKSINNIPNARNHPLSFLNSTTLVFFTTIKILT